MTSPVSCDEYSVKDRFTNKSMQRGLLAKALAYTNSAMGTSPPTSPTNENIATATGRLRTQIYTVQNSNTIKEDMNNNTSNTSNLSEIRKTETRNNIDYTVMSAENSSLNKDQKSSASSVASEEESTTNVPLRHLSFDSTQKLRTGFFRSIKRQYSPIIQESEVVVGNTETDTVPDMHNFNQTSQKIQAPFNNDSPVNMTKFARKKLEQFRNKGLESIDVGTGLQWIRLELHEMREQDKSLFLQLIKLHSNIKDLRTRARIPSDCDSYDDLHDAASLWWPRYSSSILPDFSSSDGAQLLKGSRSSHPQLRRGYSLNYPPEEKVYGHPYDIINNSYKRNSRSNHFRSDSVDSEASHISLCSTTSSTRSATAC